ncbi:hypothetical protein SIN8267_01560 [Sinobacterium norvegicum]|uniref:Lipoprotein n=2 Tax=Sinobacterium norvegicum TaxID=1641715 RepID=A0ABN8EGC3_9GAMM|nr:hypothetical protein SIN8267_01560 [Sinobacterium norvegicum]
MAAQALNRAGELAGHRHLLVALMVVFLAACGAAPEKPQPSVPIKLQPSKAELQQQSAERQRKWVAFMLMEADQAFERNRLMKPKGDNAYDRYRQILDIEPNNLAAKAGIKHISRRYLTLAKEAFDRGNVRSAQDYVYQSQKIDPNYAGARAMAAYIKQYSPPATVNNSNKSVDDGAVKAPMADSQYNEYLLDSGDLAAKNSAVDAQLDAISQLASQWQSRLLIVARNDAQGRWIYQQLKAKAEGYRFRANIEVGKLPRVVLLDQPLLAEVDRTDTATTSAPDTPPAEPE